MALGQEDATEVLVMFDIGDGAVSWETVPLGENRTAIKATEDAAAAAGLSLEVSWSAFGAFVADIGDRDPVFPEYFHFLFWNTSILDWDLAPVGASSLLLGGGETLGWFLSADDPDWDFVSAWPGPRPLATPLHPAPWVGFRGGPSNRGVSSGDVPETPGLRWRFDTGGNEIGASPIGAAGAVYQVTLFNGTYAIDIRSGTLQWKAAEVSGLSTPALLPVAGRDAPDLVVGAKDGALYRLDGRDGAVVWRKPLQEAGFTGIASSPQISGGRVLVGLFNESGGPGGLVSVDLGDGSRHWTNLGGTRSVHMSSPTVHRGAVYVGFMGVFNPSALDWDPFYGLLSLHELNGSERWVFLTSGPVASTPALFEDVLYFTTRDGYLYAVDTEGSLRFRAHIGPSTSSPAVGSGMIFAGSGVLGTGGNVTAFDLQGNQIWQFRPNGPVQSSLTLAGDRLLFATNAEVGTVYALETATGAVAWSYVPQPPQYILPTPTVFDRVVVVATDSGFVYAVEEAVPATFDVGLLATALVIVAGVVVIVAIAVYARRFRGPQ